MPYTIVWNTNGVRMTEIGFGKLGKMGSLDLSRLKSGVKKTDLQNDVQKSIFDKVDKNGNGVLEEGEVNALSQSLQELAGKDNNISDKTTAEINLNYMAHSTINAFSGKDSESGLGLMGKEIVNAAEDKAKDVAKKTVANGLKAGFKAAIKHAT